MLHSQTINKTEKRNDIQGLRALAVIAVVLYHAGLPISGGYSGVDIFFVISGFVITGMLVREWEKNGSCDFKNFYYRRFKRIIPALAVVVTATALAAIFIVSPFGNNLNTVYLTGIGSILSAANFIIATKTGGYFEMTATSNPLLNTWSLSVEEQFYILFPITLILSIRVSEKNSFKNFALLSTLLIGLISLASIYIGVYYFLENKLFFGYYSPLSRAWEFAAGAFIALISVDKKLSKNEIISIELFAATLITVTLILFDEKTKWPGIATFFPVLGTALFLYVGNNRSEQTFLSKILSSRIAVFIGDISYSWYLWHWPVIVFVGLYLNTNRYSFFAAIISIIPAVISYYFIENSIRNYEFERNRSKISFILLTIFIPILFCYFSKYTSENSYWSSDIVKIKKIINEDHASKKAGCALGYVPIDSSDVKCTWNAGKNGKPIYLVGDSNADHVSEGVIYAANKISSPVTIFSKGGCPFVGKSWSDRSDDETKLCNEYINNMTLFLSKSKPGIVVLGISESVWVTDGLTVGPSKDKEYSDQNAIQNYLSNELIIQLAEIKKAGHKIIILLPVPKFLNSNNKALFDPSLCTAFSVHSGQCPPKIQTTLLDQDLRQGHARKAMLGAANINKDNILDLRKIMCKNNVCKNFQNDEIMYRDAGHITVETSKKLGEEFYLALREIQ